MEQSPLMMPQEEPTQARAYDHAVVVDVDTGDSAGAGASKPTATATATKNTDMKPPPPTTSTSKVKFGEEVVADDEAPTTSYHPQRQPASWADSFRVAKKETQKTCFPTGFTPHLIPLFLSLFALGLTGAGSWDCSYFKGATISFTGGHYGLWTLEDSLGKCQLWDVLFFSYNLGPHLTTARIFSMVAMLLGLALLTTAAQASQYHVFSWGIALVFFVLFIISVSTTSTYNVWIVFWLFSYVIFVLIVRYLFVHPVPRRISKRGSKIIGSLYILNGFFCLFTLVVLRSDYCTCQSLDSQELEGREIGDPCQQVCRLGAAGGAMIAASLFWFVAGWACFQFHIQPDHLRHSNRRSPSLYAHYPQQSIYTRAHNMVSRHGSSQSGSTGRAKHSSAEIVGYSGSSISTGAESSVMGLPPRVVTSSMTTDDSVGADHEIAGGGLGGTARHSMESIHESDVQGADEEEEENEATDNQALEELHRRLSEMEYEDDADNRGCCQKLCCDFRVKKRSKREMYIFWTLRVLLGFGFVMYGFFLFMLIGSRAENDKAANAPSTSKYFTLDAVCAFNPLDPYEEFRTFDNKELAHLANYTIAHCGECAYCSNPHDIQVYVETRKTIAKKSKQCGAKVYFGGLTDCLEDKIGFHRPCTQCWADNMINTADKCLFTCLRTLFSGFMAENNVQGAGEDSGWLNACLYCDEKRSGPAFVTCSGVARRRLGIVSEIERNPEEQCQSVDVDWVNVDFDEIGFE